MADFACVRAADAETLREVVRVRAECYSADVGREVPAAPDRYDFQENCPSFLLVRSGRPNGLGAIRPCLFLAGRPELPVPISELYLGEVERNLGPGVSFVQSTHFVVSPTLKRTEIAPRLLLFREVFRTAIENRAGHIITVVRDLESYFRFYERLGFRRIASGKIHPTLGVPTALLWCEFSTDRLRRILESRRLAAIIQGFDLDGAADRWTERSTPARPGATTGG